MSVFSMIAIVFLIVKAGKSFLDGLFDQPKAINKIREINNFNVKYYSEGIELPYPFHVEYKVIVNAMEKSWIYKHEHQELVNENHDAPILDRVILIPIKKEFSYTVKHVFLANAYMQDQKEYLGNLN